MDSVTLSSNKKVFFSKIWSEFSENIFDFFFCQKSSFFDWVQLSQNSKIPKIFISLEAVRASWYKRSPTLTSWVYTDPTSVRIDRTMSSWADHNMLVKISGRAVRVLLSRGKEQTWIWKKHFKSARQRSRGRRTELEWSKIYSKVCSIQNQKKHFF